MTLTEIFVRLARARTAAERNNLLVKAANMGRFDEDQRAELRQLAAERDHSSIHTLRPLSNPVAECRHLDPLVPTSPPVLSAAIEVEVAEWVQGWQFAFQLELAGLRPPGPLLIHGPTGGGKSMLCGTLAQRIGRPGVVAECHNLIDSHLGSTGERLSSAFKAADKAGAVLVIEELDALAANRAGTGEGASASQENTRITVALMRMIEGARFPVVATTNRPEALDAALVRRFEYQVAVPAMPREIRHQIIAEVLGHVPADLAELPLNEALPRARRRVRSEFVAKAASAAQTES